MTALSDIKASAKEIYAKYDSYLIPLGKFFLAFLSFSIINGRLGYMKALDSLIIILILALFCSFMSANAIVVIGAGLILGHLYALSIPALIVGGGIVIILLLLYFGLSPRESYSLIFTILALALKIPCAVPVVLGLVAAPFAIFPVCLGTVVYYTLRAVNGTGSVAVAEGAEKSLAILGDIQQQLQAVLQEKEMVLMVVLMAAVLLIVYLIRRLAIKHAWRAAIITGSLTYFGIYTAGSLMLGISGAFLWAVLGTLLAVIVGLAVQLLLFEVDYTKTTSVQFEDEEYYYYVKAVPKIRKGRDVSGDH